MKLAVKLGFAAVLLTAAAGAQNLGFGSPHPRQSVTLLSDAANVAAGKPDVVELRFRVGAGLHINSHTPKDETLLPTRLEFASTPVLRVLGEEYPAGESMRLTVGPGETMNVYQGEFRVRLRVQARAGEATLLGELHYQACDAASCFPPRVLPVKVELTAK